MTKPVLGFLALLLFASCSKSTVLPNADVDEFIWLLKKNQYTQRQLPEFVSGDIPALLEYRHDRTRISVFPVNPISSFYLEEVSVGVYVLWTIESIRQVHNRNDELILGFPSLNPILLALNNPEMNEKEIQNAAAKAYYDWWYSHEGQPFSLFSSIDPLEPIGIKWQ